MDTGPKLCRPQSKSLDPRDWKTIGDYWTYIRSLGWSAAWVSTPKSGKPRIRVEWLTF